MPESSSNIRRLITRRNAAVAAAFAVLAIGGFAAADEIERVSPFTASETAIVTAGLTNCNDWPVQLTQTECYAAGTIRYVALYNLQGAAQFCKWRSANPGEWTRLKDYAASEIAPANVITWLGGSVRNQLEAYFATGAPAFIIEPNTAPNRCRTPVPPPTVLGVTPGQTDATVTVTTP